MRLSDLHAGIYVPEFGTRVPWLITENELFEYIPKDNFTFSLAGWPMLQCSILGVRALFGWNFVTHPDERLIELQFENSDQETIKQTVLAVSDALREHLGEPNVVSLPENQRWQDEHILVINRIGTGYRPLLKKTLTSHRLQVVFFSGMPPRPEKRPA